MLKYRNRSFLSGFWFKKIYIFAKDLQYIKGNDYIGVDMNYQGKPFTGFEIDGYYENGQIAGEIEYVNGEQMGWVIEFYDNGFVERRLIMVQLRYILMNLIETEIKQ